MPKGYRSFLAATRIAAALRRQKRREALEDEDRAANGSDTEQPSLSAIPPEQSGILLPEDAYKKGGGESAEGGGKTSVGGFFQRLTVSEWLTFLIGVGSLAVSVRSCQIAADTSDLQNAVGHLSDMANAAQAESNAMESEVTVQSKQVTLLGSQLGEMQRQTRFLSNQSGSQRAEAKSIAEQGLTARDVEIKGLRAYVDFDRIDTNGDPTKIPNLVVTVSFGNEGRTPAYNVRSRVTCVTVFDGSIETEVPTLTVKGLPFSLFNMVQNQIVHNIARCNMSPAMVANVASGEAILVVYGWIDYVDIFGSAHKSDFKYYYDPQRKDFDAAPNGNRAT